MEATFQTSLSPLRSKITLIEAMELVFLTFGVWCLTALVDIRDSGINISKVSTYLISLELIVLGSWVVYNVYIRIARAGGRRIDLALWMIASAFTGSYTFWAWTILDINRLLIAKLLYQGEAPVEYAWSARSKQIRKRWEQAQKAGSD